QSPSWIITSIVFPCPNRWLFRASGRRYGAFDMLSMPPAMTTSASPVLIAWTPKMIDFRPEPQTLLTVTAPTPSTRPPRRAARRDGFWPRPAWRTQPMKTSSTALGASSARRAASRTTSAPRAGEGKALRPPRNLPIGVRTAETMKASVTPSLSAIDEKQSREAPLLNEPFCIPPVRGAERRTTQPSSVQDDLPKNNRDRRSSRLPRRSRGAPGPPRGDVGRPRDLRRRPRRPRPEAPGLRRARDEARVRAGQPRGKAPAL